MKIKMNVRIAISMSILLMLFSGLSAFGQKLQFVGDGSGTLVVFISPGSFWMGDEDNGPVHRVTISRGFWMGATEVTERQWQEVMGNIPSPAVPPCENCPVENVSWDDVQEFIRKLNARYPGSNYRLPTEAEWEYAASAGTRKYRALDGNLKIYLNRGGKQYGPYKPDQLRAWLDSGQVQPNDYAWYAGAANWQSLWSLLVDPKEFSDEELDAVAWYMLNNGSRMQPVGTKKPNAWGLYDMHGNVREWVQDWYGAYPSEAVTDPTGPTSGEGRVLRGYERVIRNGDNYEVRLRSADRDYLKPFRHCTPTCGRLVSIHAGFRLALNAVY